MRVSIKNFRSVREQEVEVAPITVMHGPNGAGKSSLLYALLTLKNVVLNPNQSPAGFFNYVFLSLGSFEAVVYDHLVRNNVEVGVTLPAGKRQISYRVAISESQGRFTLQGDDAVVPRTLNLAVPFPYPANQPIQDTMTINEVPYAVTWNGITSQVQPGQQTPESLNEAIRLATVLNTPAETIRRVGVVPLKRGFSKPHFSVQPISPLLITEDEIATMLSQNKYLVSRISYYLEEIIERDFRVNVQPGTSIFSLDATDKHTGVASELVNEGFGVNQVVFFLSRCLHQDVETVCIEEPEVHLHPTAIRKLAKALVKMMKEEGKRFVISTHSEAFLGALLGLVASGQLAAADLACYFAKKDGKETVFERQRIHENGQIEGGLAGFIQGEVEDIQAFLKLS